MNIEEALKIRGKRSRIVQVSVASPDWESSGWNPGGDDSFLWIATVFHSDGQYGGGRYIGKGKTMESAIDDAVANFQKADASDVER